MVIIIVSDTRGQLSHLVIPRILDPIQKLMALQNKFRSEQMQILRKSQRKTLVWIHLIMLSEMDYENVILHRILLMAGQPNSA